MLRAEFMSKRIAQQFTDVARPIYVADRAIVDYGRAVLRFVVIRKLGAIALSRIASMKQWPFGSGELVERIRAHDWSSTPLGPTDLWPDRLKSVIELMLASPLVSTVALTADRLLLYNDAAAQLYGARHPQALGRPLRETFPDTFPIVAQLYDRVFAGESVTVAAQPLAVGTEGGSEVFDAYLTPVRAADGTVIGAHMTGFEIGARIHAEASLRRSEQRLSTVLNGISDAFYALDKDWRFLFVSRAALAIWGKRAEDVVGRSFLECFPQAEGSEPYCAHQRVMAGGGAEHLETLSPVLNRWIEVNIAPTPDGGLWLAFHDIEERKRTETALRESEAERRTLIAEMNEGFCILEVILDEAGRGIDYRFLETNPAFVRQGGFDPAGRLMSEIAPIEPVWPAAYGRVATTGVSERIVDAAAAFGRTYDVYAFRIGAAADRRIAVFFTDISARSAAAQAPTWSASVDRLSSTPSRA